MTEGFFVLNYNLTMAVDYNKDFITDHLLAPDGKKYIQVNGRLIPVLKIVDRTATLPDGKTMRWHTDRWQ